MQKLIFVVNRETFVLTVEGKEIYYSDRKLLHKVRLIPQDADLKRRIILSRNRLSPNILQWFSLNKEEQAEYDSAKTEDELAEICIKDAKKQGALLEKREVIDNEMQKT